MSKKNTRQQLLLHDRTLLNLEEGRELELASLEPAAIALAAREIATGRESGPAPAILFAPPSMFIATPCEPPAVAAADLPQALLLQRHQLLPGIEGALLVACDGGELAFWMREEEAEALYLAFAEAGLLLAGIAPRPLAAAGGRDLTLLDEDGEFLTLVAISQGRVRQWRQIAREEAADPALNPSWESEARQAEAVYRRAGDWRKGTDFKSVPYSAVPDSVLITPPGAARLFAEDRRRRLKKRAATIGGAILALLALPLLAMHGFNAYLETKIAELRRENREILAIQAEVGEFEEKWAPVRELPALELVPLLERLEKLLPQDSWLTSFKAANGTVELEGVSGNAARLLEILSGQPDFSEVSFSRAISTGPRRQQGDQFGIRFRLKDFAVEEYLRRHFPVERQVESSRP